MVSFFALVVPSTMKEVSRSQGFTPSFITGTSAWRMACGWVSSSIGVPQTTIFTFQGLKISTVVRRGA